MDKVKNLFSGVIIGILLLIGGTVLLWWNEGNNVRNIRALEEVKKSVIDVSGAKVDSKNEGKVIATNGEFVVEDEALVDDEFKISVKTARLERVVEVYQWQERSETDDNDHTTYS